MEQIAITPGTYIVAVSGGVDSMVLLDIARQLTGVSLVVAHVDHGIRKDSSQDKELVERVAMSHNIPFESIQLALGSGVSEERARDERYKFLRHIQKRYAADGILVAHHADDVLETALINLARGTGWRGLSSLRSQGGIVRPLLPVKKSEIIEYAHEHHISWREDSTNADTTYARNAIRARLAHADDESLQKLNEIIVRQNELTQQIEQQVAEWLSHNSSETNYATTLPRYQLIMLPEHVAHEVLQTVLRRKSGKSATRPQIARAVLFAKVAKVGKRMPLNSSVQLRTTRHEVIVEVGKNVIS